jgi:hypothetical protein
MRRLAWALVLALAATFASANAALPHVQTVPGDRIAAIADRIAGQLVSGPDRRLTPAFKIVDQTVPRSKPERRRSTHPTWAFRSRSTSTAGRYAR